MREGLTINERGSLVFGGWDVSELSERFGTPLYVLSEEAVRGRCAQIRESFLRRWENVSAVYAGKAFLTLAMCRIVQFEGLGLDLVSGGELYVARSAGFPLKNAFLHGNGKTVEELSTALSAGVGRIVVDGLSELEALEEAAASAKKRADILLRVSPGVDPRTHRHIITGHAGSKFGFPAAGDLLGEAVERAMSSDRVRLRGFHFHIGSQIFENDSHVMSVEILTDLMAGFRRDLGLVTEELNMGGGFGVDFSLEGRTPRIEEFTDPMMSCLEESCRSHGMDRPHVTIEPGRWIVSEAGITLYSVQTVKRVGDMTYAAVDGGMADNPRPSLYGAKYRAVAAGRMNDDPTETVTLAGKCCESGDILVEGMRTPPLERGDLVAVLNTGAYNFSMASNYNRLPRPAVVLASEGRADVIVARQSYEDLLLGESIPDHLA
ncbi:MAG: diaminopimelate decarboxylase [Synergistaceae bacterium]|nr:diaminopimelate decarboxylase [Synergistaceae bacterium]